jgi:ATP-dependent RNA helicase DeaD
MPFPSIHPALDRALAARGYTEPTPVQRAVIEADQNNADMLVSAQTGSGKTVAFGLILASTLLRGATRLESSAHPCALIIAPTRELAIQISREFEWLFAETGAKIAIAVGGTSVRLEQQQLSRGAHIVIGTPGRLCDHLSRGFLDLSALQAVVLDEADEMLDLGFREELETLLDATPAETRRTLLFSATIPRGIAMLAQNFQHNAIRIDTISATTPHDDIDYRAMTVAMGEADRAVVNILRYFEPGAALVFCATREAVRRLHSSLLERGFQSVALSGEMNQRERNEALQSLREGRARVCVATDVAARGLDLPDLSLVIHADLPTNRATLLHRSGRTGRAGRKGLSVLLVPQSRRRRTEQVLASANVRAAWSAPPAADDIYDQDRQRLLAHPALHASLSPQDVSLAGRMAETLSSEQLAAALISLLRKALPEPENLSPVSSWQASPALGKQSDSTGDRQRGPRKGLIVEEGLTWFRLGVGRERHADPKWIIPLLCRRGRITKSDIGPIRIFQDETKVAIRGDAATAFASAVGELSDDSIEIRPSTPPDSGDFSAAGGRGRRRGERALGDRTPERRTSAHSGASGSGRQAQARQQGGQGSAKENRPARTDKDDGLPPAVAAQPAGEERLTASTPPADGLNRRQRRDAARAAGLLAPVSAPPPPDTLYGDDRLHPGPKRGSAGRRRHGNVDHDRIKKVDPEAVPHADRQRPAARGAFRKAPRRSGPDSAGFGAPRQAVRFHGKRQPSEGRSGPKSPRGGPGRGRGSR